MAHNVASASDTQAGTGPNTRRGRSVVHNLHANSVFVTTYRRGAFNTEMLNRCEQVMAQVCADFDATLAEFNGEEDLVHLLVQYPPKVALSHLVNSSKGASSRRLPQDFASRINPAAMRDRFWSRHTSPDHAVAHHCPPSRTTSPTRNDQTRKGFPPALKDGVSTQITDNQGWE